MSLEHSPEREDEVTASGDRLLDDYLTKDECAAELKIGPRTLERWHRLREGPPRTIIGRQVLYHKESVRRWIRSHEQVMEV